MLKTLKLCPPEKPADYIQLAREVDACGNLEDVNIGFLSSYTAEILSPYIKVELAKKGYRASLYFAPFNQIEQEILSTKSGLYLAKPEIVIIHNRIEDIYRNLMFRFMSYSEEELVEISDNIIDRLSKILRELRKKSSTKIVVVNFANTLENSKGFICSPASHLKSDLINSLNNRLLSICQSVSSCITMNYSQLLTNHGLNKWEDPKLYYLAKIPFDSRVQIEMGKSISRVVSSLGAVPKKCLVLDLDNTLWGGVIGEDGIAGIKLSEEYPGNVYRDFQRAVLDLRDQGVLLAIASKNNIADVLSVLNSHTACLVSKEDFSAIRINWKDKAENLESISLELNIGLDSIVFFDDNPIERQWVKEQLPEVSVIDVPESPLGYIDALVSSCHFDNAILTDEDKARSELYHREKKRKEYQNQSNSVEDFLTSLQMKLTIGSVDEMSISRAVQLMGKTNQFNMTTRRHTVEDLNKMISLGYIALWVSVKDRFGDSGISGVAIVKKIDCDEWMIDTFLISCRIIGRKIETSLLSVLSDMVFKKSGKILYGEYIPTKKNSFVASFYKEHGFIKCQKEKKTVWKINLKKKKVISPDFITITNEYKYD